MAAPTPEEKRQLVAAALSLRARTSPERASQLTDAYLDAAVARAVSVTTAAEPPPTAMRQSLIALLVELVEHFDDIPTANELAALFRITPTAARSLLNDVLATSDVASSRLLKSVFLRATKGQATSPESEIPNGVEWHFQSANDLSLGRTRLEFAGVVHRTRSTKDGVYVLLVDPDFDPDGL